MTISLVYQCMFAALRSIQVAPASPLTNTPEESVNFSPVPSSNRRPENVATTVPSFSTRRMYGCPCVRGGFGSFVHVDDAPRFKLLVTQIPPALPASLEAGPSTTIAYMRFALFGSSCSHTSGWPNSCTSDHVPPLSLDTITRPFWYDGFVRPSSR